MPTPKTTKTPTTNNYYVEDDEKEITETIIKELNLNYDYLGVNDVSNISAEVSIWL